MQVHGFAINVSHWEYALQLFTETLECEVEETGRLDGVPYEELFGKPGSMEVARLALGRERLWMFHHNSRAGVSYPEDFRANDPWFQHLAIVVSDMDAAYRKVLAAGCTPVSKEPQTIPEWNTSAAGIRAFYFREKYGHPLELIWFPPGKGRAIWQEPGGTFLGIDHTAIAVRDTERSQRFYRDCLGMSVAGGSLNYGTTQEELSGVRGARVKITGLRYPDDEGPGIEFLEYLEPHGGRPPLPADPQNSGIKMSTLRIDDLDATLALVPQAGGRVLGKTDRLPNTLKIRRAAVVVDPDEHIIMLAE